MTLWLDAHLDPELAVWLGSRYKIAAKALRDIGLRDADDLVLFEAARRFSATGAIVIMTKDDDFVDLVRQRGKPPHIIWLTCGNTSTSELKSLMIKQFEPAWKAVENGAAIVEISGDNP